jgi:hypothetical protein
MASILTYYTIYKETFFHTLGFVGSQTTLVHIDFYVSWYYNQWGYGGFCSWLELNKQEIHTEF